MNKLLLFFTIIFLIGFSDVKAQDSFTVRAQRYIQQYHRLAVKEQLRSGVPASITLAQGVLETEAGMSELACMANNHFGIKCKSDYIGDKFFHDDDRPKECFKMYPCVEESYKDHSDYLIRNKRYAPLFTYSQTDYASWAKGLKKCGYATNPQYAQRLIKIIEDFKLQEYTYLALDSGTTYMYNMAFDEGKNILDSAKAIGGKSNKPVAGVKMIQPTSFAAIVPDSIRRVDTMAKAVAEPAKDSVKPAATAIGIVVKEELKKADTQIVVAKDTIKTTAPAPVQEVVYDSGKIIIVNGLKAFYAHKGDVLLQYAQKYNVRYGHLLEINDLQDAPLIADMVVYLERKLNFGTHAKHIVKEGETMLLIAQAEGMHLKKLMELNMMDNGDEPAVGATIELQNGVVHKPSLRPLPNPDLRTSPNLSYVKPTPKDEYLPTVHETTVVDTPTIKKDISRDAMIATIHLPPDTTQKVKPAATPTVPAQPVIEHQVTPVAVAPVKPAEPAPAEVPVHLQKTDTVKHGMSVTYDQPAPKPVPAPVPAADPAPAAPVAPAKPVANNTATDTADDLAALKAKLDKVVYADNSNLVPAPVKGEIKEPIKLSTSLYGPLPEKKAGKKHKGEEQDDEKPAKKNAKTAVKPAAKYYTVKKGDNLSNIAHRNGTTVKKLEELNDIDLDHLHLGQKIRLK